MNGSAGRARILGRIRRERLAEAQAAGVDISDRVAVTAWVNARSMSFYARIRDEAAEMRRRKITEFPRDDGGAA